MKTAISIKNLRKTYDNGFEALKGISLEVEQGIFFALLGPNGKIYDDRRDFTLVNRSAGEVEVTVAASIPASIKLS